MEAIGNKKKVPELNCYNNMSVILLKFNIYMIILTKGFILNLIIKKGARAFFLRDKWITDK